MLPYSSAKAEQRKKEHDDDHEAYEIDDAVHFFLHDNAIQWSQDEQVPAGLSWLTMKEAVERGETAIPAAEMLRYDGVGERA